VARLAPARDDFTVVEVEGEMSLLHPGTHRVLVLNRTATDVWLLCDGEHDLPEVVALLGTAYGVSAESIAAEVGTVVDELLDEGFVIEFDDAV
jgi:hypothetical protein